MFRFEGDTMKTTIFITLSTILLFGSFQMAQARCTPNDPYEQHGCPKQPTSNYGILKALMFGKVYCDVGYNRQSGISISQEGIVTFFSPNLGAPNPRTYFAVVPGALTSTLNSEASFGIQEFQTSNRTPIGPRAYYNFHRYNKFIYSGNKLFSSSACGANKTEAIACCSWGPIPYCSKHC